MQITAKIVYYGPGLCGKTTNLQHIHQKTAARSRGEMVSLETETDRTLFFDLLPLDVGIIGGMKVRLQVYTVPGQVFYNATRKLVLKGVDGVVFVADSQLAMEDANVESLANLHANLNELGVPLASVPLVFQYNKRDLRNILPVDRLNATINSHQMPYHEAAALHGIGVFETLKTISRYALGSIRKKLATEESQRPSGEIPAMVFADDHAVSPVASPAPPPTPVVPPPASPEPPSSSGNLLADLVEAPVENEDEITAEVEVPVEFAEEDTDQHRVRPVQTKGSVDVHQELEKLRALANTPIPGRASTPKARKSSELERKLKDVITSVSDSPPRLELKRKAGLFVPVSALRGASALRVQLTLDGEDDSWSQEAITLHLIGNRKLDRLTLRLEIDLRGKDE